ncbi:hypothetical protein ZWY2020_048974 [Hordeum vulgare]|nr:hypothetical protein ZWY2020_048974 [Hordeum vulgare]
MLAPWVSWPVIVAAAAEERETHRSPRPTPTRCGCSFAASFNGWADLRAAADGPLGLPFLCITHESLAAALLLLLIPVAALSLSRFLASAPCRLAADSLPGTTLRPPGSSTQRLAALLADLDARLLSLKDRLLASADNDDGDRGHPILEPLDRARAKPQSVLIALGSEGVSTPHCVSFA